jgi:hypothetical protein
VPLIGRKKKGLSNKKSGVIQAPEGFRKRKPGALARVRQPDKVGGLAMGDQRSQHDYDETEDLLMNEDVEFFDDGAEEESNDDISSRSNRSFNLSMRHRIEDKLEERRLMKELNEYEFFDLEDDEDILH